MSRVSRTRAIIRGYSPTLLLFIASTWVLVTMWRDKSYSTLETLRVTNDLQQKQNSQSDRQIAQLKHRIHALQLGGRELEKTARNELGMARPGELVFIFDEPKGAE